MTDSHFKHCKFKVLKRNYDIQKVLKCSRYMSSDLSKMALVLTLKTRWNFLPSCNLTNNSSRHSFFILLMLFLILDGSLLEGRNLKGNLSCYCLNIESLLVWNLRFELNSYYLQNREVLYLSILSLQFFFFWLISK